MQNIPNQETMKNLEEVLSKMSPQEANKLIFQTKAFEKFGEKGEDLAMDLLEENPSLAESEQEFWNLLEAKISKQQF